jgi:hypothetical protein
MVKVISLYIHIHLKCVHLRKISNKCEPNVLLNYYCEKNKTKCVVHGCIMTVKFFNSIEISCSDGYAGSCLSMSPLDAFQ